MKTIISACLLFIFINSQIAVPTACGDTCGFNTINVNGQGKVSGKPDIATIDLTLQTAGKDTKAAIQALSNLQLSIISTLGRFGVGKDSYTFGNYNSYANYTADAGDYAQIASQSIYIKVNPSKQSPVSAGQTLLSVLVDNLALQSSVQLNTITYDISNKDSLLNQARTLAYQDANGKASDYASALGLRLGSPSSVSDSYSSIPVVYNQKGVQAMALRSDASQSTNVAVGNVDVTYNLNVIYKYV